MRNKITEQDISKFMDFKKPNKGIGFFSDDYSADKEDFIEGVEGFMDGNFSGYILIETKEKAHIIFDKIQKKMEEKNEELIASSAEDFLALYDLEDGTSLIVNTEFGGSEDLCLELKKISKNKGILLPDNMCLCDFERATDEDDYYEELPEQYKKAFRSIQLK